MSKTTLSRTRQTQTFSFIDKAIIDCHEKLRFSRIGLKEKKIVEQAESHNLVIIVLLMSFISIFGLVSYISQISVFSFLTTFWRFLQGMLKHIQKLVN